MGATGAATGSLGLPEATMGEPCFVDGYAVDRLTRASHPQAQSELSTATRGLGLTSAADKRFTEATGSICEALWVMYFNIVTPLGG